MAEHGGGGHGQSSETEIHLPSPTLAPPILGLGVMILTFGVVGLAPVEANAPNPVAPLAIPLHVLGAQALLGGIVLWLVNDARDFVKAGDHGGHGGH